MMDMFSDVTTEITNYSTKENKPTIMESWQETKIDRRSEKHKHYGKKSRLVGVTLSTLSKYFF